MRRVLREYGFNVAGVLFAGIAAYATLADTGDIWPIALLCLGFFVMGNLDRFESLKAGPGGIEAITRETREALKETKDRIEELKELAFLFGATTIANICFMGRWDGYTDEQEEKMISDIVAYFEKIGISKEQALEALHPRFITTEHDYRLLCTGGRRLPEDLPQDKHKEWEAIRAGGVTKIAKPDEIEAFFKANGMMNDQRAELLEDYRYYLANRTHRRPEIWAQRNEFWK